MSVSCECSVYFDHISTCAHRVSKAYKLVPGKAIRLVSSRYGRDSNRVSRVAGPLSFFFGRRRVCRLPWVSITGTISFPSVRIRSIFWVFFSEEGADVKTTAGVVLSVQVLPFRHRRSGPKEHGAVLCFGVCLHSLIDNVVSTVKRAWHPTHQTAVCYHYYCDCTLWWYSPTHNSTSAIRIYDRPKAQQRDWVLLSPFTAHSLYLGFMHVLEKVNSEYLRYIRRRTK